MQGRVTNGTGEPLPGVNVTVKGTTQGTIADVNGRYQLNVGDGETLVFSFIGFDTYEVDINNRGTIDLTMAENVEQLSEVVVVGYGTQQRANLTSAISSVSAKEIKDQPVPSVESALQGRAAGVNITASSGTPGAALRVSVRGATSITASSEPLYVIDGIPMISEDNSALFTGGSNANSLADINPSDIESIEILKDASAAAIYGSRASNGVVLITTKRGQEGKAKINVGYYTGISQPANVIDMMDAREFVNMMDEAAANDGWGENFYSEEIMGYDLEDPERVETDWYDEIFRQDAPISNYELSASGGTDRVRYYTGGSYFTQDGYQRGQDFKRLSGRINLDFDATDKLTVGTNVSLSRTSSRRTIGDNSLYGVVINALAADPTMPVFEEDGTYASPFSYYSWWAYENPRLATDEYRRTTSTIRGLGTVYADYEVVPNLHFRSTWSADYQNLVDESFLPSFTQQAIDNEQNGLGLYATANTLTWINENTLTYDYRVSNHQLSALLGYSQQRTYRDLATSEAFDYPGDVLGNLALAAVSETTDRTETEWGLESYIGRLNYNYDDRYLATVTTRVDGSSRFGRDRRYGVFPSGSVAWRVSEEEFLTQTSWLNDLKLRVSYGLTGNQDGIGNFASRSLYGLTSPYLGQGGASVSQLGNADLGWETTAQFNAGLDVTVFNGRIGLTADYFLKNTTDLLLASSVPAYLGRDVATRNLGAMRNSGVELALNTVNIDRALRWTTNFNITFIQNEITELVNDGEVFGSSGEYILKEGESISTFRLIKFLGVDPQTGNSIFQDTDGNGTIDADDAVIVGNALPDYYGGITNTLTYKNFDLTAFFNFMVGQDIFNHSRYAYEQVGWSFNFGGFFLPYGNNSQRVVDGRWQQPGDQTDIPRASLGWALEEDGSVTQLDQNWQEYSDQWLEDGSFLRLRQLTFGYTLPSELLERARIFRNVRFYAQGQNLFMLTNYLGQDPEVSSNGEDVRFSGEDYGALGQARTYIFGVNLGF
ncbi:MAG: TonB-dependent receptor [Catalinimonas sp.]